MQNDLLDCYNNGIFSKSGSVTPIAVMIAMFLAYLNGVDMSVLKHIYTVLNTGIIENVEDRCIIKLRDKILTMKGNGRTQTAARITYTMDCISTVSRKSAAEQIRQGKFIYTYKKIFTTSVCQATLDEAPQAYKPMQEIMKNIQDTVEVMDIWKPVYNYKSNS